MANNVVQPGQMQEPGELLDPEKGSKFEQYKIDGVYEYGIKNGKKDKSRVRVMYYEGDVFEGTLRYNKYVGFGKYTWKNGGVYEGTFKRGKLNGKGKYTEVNGETYEGEFKNNKYNGAGKYTWTDGSSFDGIFKNGRIVSGRYTDADGNLYSCTFKYKRNGERKIAKMQLLRVAPTVKLKNDGKHEEKKAAKNTEKKAEKQTDKSPEKKPETKAEKQDDKKAAPQQKRQTNKNGLTARDASLITSIRKSARGAEFKNLYSGASGKSEASDKKLMVILNFFSGSDAEQMQRIFKSSKIYDAAKGQDYLTDLVNGAIHGGKEFTNNLRAAQKGKQQSNNKGAEH